MAKPRKKPPPQTKKTSTVSPQEETTAGPSSESNPTHEDKMETSSSTPDTNVLQQLPTLSDKSIMVLEGYPLGFPLDRIRDHPLVESASRLISRPSKEETRQVQRLRRLAYSSGEPIPVEQITPRVFTRKLHTWNRPANPDTISSPKNNIATGTPPSIPLRPEHSRVIPQHNSTCSNCGNPNNSTQDVDFLATLLHMGLSLTLCISKTIPLPLSNRHQWTTPSINIFRLSAQYHSTSNNGSPSLAEERYGIVLLQETLLKSDISLSNYTAYHQYQSQGNRGLSILVRKDLHVERLPFRRFCGTEVEAMGVTVSLKNTTLQIYNIYRPPKATATLNQQILQNWSLSNKILQDFPHSSLLNRHIPTHLRGGVLDLSFVSTDLLPIASWALHPYLTSDHYASTITLNIPPIQKPPTVPHWHFKKADWHKFTFILEEWAESYTPSQDLDTKEEEIVSALHHAANQAIPTYKPTSYIHSNKWYYSDRVRELLHRLIILRKTLKKHPSPTILENFRVVQLLIQKEIQTIRSDSWLKWCESLNAHTSLHDLWQKLNLVSGKFRTQPCHPRPLHVAGLIHTFQSYSTSSQLPPSTINRIQRLKPERETSIQVAISTPAESDVPFTQHEINQALKTNISLKRPRLESMSYDTYTASGLGASRIAFSVLVQDLY
ncbi:pol-like protein [Penaeus vannamei]|uniref:Pol-like protein n=1 Tax=Penaeus vannamei TaxID=6689 RepID=A0A3R7LVE3_PENVA|nr:pol-like protein [Penaeus vannamei]